MKKQIWMSALALVALFAVAIGCNQFRSGLGNGNPFSGTTAKNPVEEIIELCKTDNYKEAARHFINRDKCRSPQKDLTPCVADYENGDEKEKQNIERECKRMKALGNVEYKVGAEQVKQQGEMTGYLYDVEIKQGSKTEKQLWVFVKSNGKYLLIDID